MGRGQGLDLRFPELISTFAVSFLTCDLKHLWGHGMSKKQILTFLQATERGSVGKRQKQALQGPVGDFTQHFAH